MPDYIDVPVVTDPAALEQLAYDTFQAEYPGWAPADGGLDTITIQAAARIASVVANLASAVPKSIARFIGPLFGVIPVDATAATVPTTWTMIDNTGHTIPAGTIAGIPDGAGNLVSFQTIATVVVPAGQTATGAGAVTMEATTPGATGSGLGTVGGTVQLVNILAAVASITQTDVSTGGVDAETDDAYLDRFRSNAQLLAPRPILPADFAAILQTIPGIDRALAIDGYIPAVNEVETVTVNATGGTFTLTFTGQTTAALAYNITAAALQTALEALSNIAPGDVLVTGGPGATTPFTIEFRGAYAGTNVTQMTSNPASLTGGAQTATISTTIQGAAAQTGQARAITLAAIDENGDAPSGTALAAGQALLAAEREVNFLVAVIAATYTTIDVAYTIEVADGYDDTTVIAAVDAALATFLSPAQWGLPASGDKRAWVADPTVRRLDLATVIGIVQGVAHIDAITLAAHPNALATSDVTLPGPAGLPLAGTITGTAA